jgi:hypothetical protein
LNERSKKLNIENIKEESEDDSLSAAAERERLAREREERERLEKERKSSSSSEKDRKGSSSSDKERKGI